MDFQSKTTQADTFKTDALILPVFNGNKLSEAGSQLDSATQHYISGFLKNGDISGKTGETLTLTGTPECAAKRIILMGLGKQGETSESEFRKAFTSALNTLKSSAAKNAAFDITGVQVKNRDISWITTQAAQLTEHAFYRFQTFKSKSNQKETKLKKITFCTTEAGAIKNIDGSIKIGQAIGNGMNYTRDLGNTPANICNPTYLAQEAKNMAKDIKNMATTILDEKDMKELGMGALLSVSAGSDTPAKLIIMDYKGGKKGDQPHVLVGKGITFDTGGISLKPAPDMDNMRWDMCGAASVFGTMKTITELKLPINVIGVVAAAENMPSGTATRPGDIVTTMSGQTVEILNTDAEGRLVLCDALTYVERFKPASVIDVATLTGAVIVALGPFASGVMGNNEAVISQLKQAAETTQDKVWELPLWDEYQSLLDNAFADMGNIGNTGPKAGSITAGCYLSRFTKAYPWAHLDVAGSAFNGGGPEKGATGRPVPLLTEYLIQHSQGNA